METRITASIGPGTTIAITNGRHSWKADEPLQEGGTDVGPTPYELLVGSLAACTAVTLRLYANHKGIPLDYVRAEYAFDRVHAEDCDECDKEREGLIERIRSRVTIGGRFDDAQRKRLEQIVSRCPVHKTLTQGTAIFDSVTFEDVEVTEDQ